MIALFCLNRAWTINVKGQFRIIAAEIKFVKQTANKDLHGITAEGRKAVCIK
jgi:hypothetical protein